MTTYRYLALAELVTPLVLTLGVLCATESLPKSLKTRAARKRFWRHVETLRRNQIVREGEYRRANRHIVVTLESVSQAAQGVRQCAE